MPYPCLVGCVRPNCEGLWCYTRADVGRQTATAPDPTAPAARPGAGGGAARESDREYALRRAREIMAAPSQHPAWAIRDVLEHLIALAAPPAPAPDAVLPSAVMQHVRNNPWMHAAYAMGQQDAQKTPAPAPAGEADGYCPTCRTLTGGFYCYRCQEARDTYLSAVARRLDDRAQDAYEDGAVNKAWEYRHRADALRASIGRTVPAPAAGAADARAREVVTDDDVRRALRVLNYWPHDHPITDLHVWNDRMCVDLRRVLDADRAARRAAGEGRDA